MKNPELLRAKQARREEIERKAARSGEGGGGLKVRHDSSVVYNWVLIKSLSLFILVDR